MSITDNKRTLDLLFQDELLKYGHHLNAPLMEITKRADAMFDNLSLVPIKIADVEITSMNEICVQMSIDHDLIMIVTDPFGKFEGREEGDVIASIFKNKKHIFSGSVQLNNIVNFFEQIKLLETQ